LGSWKATVNDDDTNKDNLAASFGPKGLTFDLTNITSTNDLIKNIADNTSRTEDEARALVTDAANYSAELSTALNRLDKIEALNKLLAGKKSKNGQYSITDAEMEALGIDEKFLNSLKFAEGKSVKAWSAEDKNAAKTATKTSMSDDFKKQFVTKNTDNKEVIKLSVDGSEAE
jgi:hypothetical protein